MYVFLFDSMTSVDGCIDLCGWLVECHYLVEFGISKKDGLTTLHSVRRLFYSGFSCSFFFLFRSAIGGCLHMGDRPC